MLELKNVHVSYDTIAVLHGIDVTVNQGEIVTIIGANGAGKSTTLKSITGIISKRPPSQILFEGVDITGFKTDQIVKLGISLVPEGRHIFPQLTVLENLEMGAYHRTKKELPEIAKDLQRVYDYFPRLSERYKQYGSTLSGGEQQMLAIGRALMARPKLMMLDEPSTGLAPLVVKDIFSILKRINKEGTTILLVEQNAKMALAAADRGYVLKTGEIVLSDTGEKLLKNEDVRTAYLGEKIYAHT